MITHFFAIAHSKSIINSHVEILKPDDFGGLKSAQYLALNPQGKMPLLVTDADDVIIESDCIARYIIAKYNEVKPTFILPNLHEEALSNQICRIHDIYITSIQGCMYKANGTIFSSFGTDRKAAIKVFPLPLAHAQLYSFFIRVITEGTVESIGYY